MAARDASFSADCTVGRLIEARLDWLGTPADVADFVEAMRHAFAKAGPASVICGDWRAANVMPPDVGEALLGLLRRGNSQFCRSAVLLAGPQATFSLQVQRLFREAGNDDRRAFAQPQALLKWVAEVLTPRELERAATFLDCPLPLLPDVRVSEPAAERKVR